LWAAWGLIRPMSSLPSSNPAPPDAPVADAMLAPVLAALAGEQGLRPALAAVSAELRRLTGYEWVGFARVDAQLGVFIYESFSSDRATPIHPGYTLPLDAGVVGEAARTGEAVVVPDVRRHEGYLPLLASTQSEVALPVLLDGVTVGVLNIEHASPTDFSEWLPALRVVAAVAALLFERDALRRRLAMLEELGEIHADLSNIVLADAPLDAVLQRVVDYLYERFSLSLCTLLLVEGSRTLLLKAYAGHSVVHLQRNRPWPADRGLVGRAFRERQTVFVPDVRQDPGYLEANRLTRATLAIPIRAGGEVLGILALESPISEAFSSERRRVLEVLTGHLGGAIRLASTHQRLLESMSSLAERSADLDRANRALLRANTRLRELSLVDALTGIGNRRAFEQGIRDLWSRCAAEGKPLALMMIDIDYFKNYNDHYGHAEGDACLVRVASAIRATLRGPDDLVMRYGGEEFAVLLPASDQDEARRCAQRIQAAVAALGIRHERSPVAATVTLSLGVAVVHPGAGLRLRTLVERADRALYAAKDMGRNRAEIAT
jgi:diguanylate cyclase (GGDEF)-like protein